LAWIFIGFPVLVAFGANPEPRIGGSAFRFLGAASYALYVLHFPLRRLVHGAVMSLAHRDLADFAPWSGIAFIVGALALCWILDRYYDTPARKWLMGLVSAPRRTRPATVLPTPD
jgi:peptidoglycan/LPS O-acetylase OafA/YrhL